MNAMKWAAIDNPYGDWEAAKGFTTKREAVDHAVRNCCTGYKVKRTVAGEYEVIFNESGDTAYVCKEEHMARNGYE